MEKLTLRSNVVHFHRNKNRLVYFIAAYTIDVFKTVACTIGVIWNKKEIIFHLFYKSRFYSSEEIINKVEMVAKFSEDVILPEKSWKIHSILIQSDPFEDVCVIPFPHSTLKLASTNRFSAVSRRKKKVILEALVFTQLTNGFALGSPNTF